MGAARNKRLRIKESNAGVRRRAHLELQRARSIYGGGLATPLPAVDQTKRSVPANANLIFPDTRHRKKPIGHGSFNPEHSTSFDFFRSWKSQSLFSHYHEIQN